MGDITQLLAACVSRWGRDVASAPGTIPLPAGGEQRTSLITAARRHGVVGAVHLCLVETFGDAGRDLEADYLRDVAHHLRATAALGEVADAFDGNGVPWVTFKGPVLAVHGYPRPDLRSYRDLDVLVPSPRLPEAIAALKRHGYIVADRNWRLFHEEVRGEIHLTAPGRPPIDLHWHPVNWQGARRGMTVDPHAWIERARRVPIDGHEMATLDVPDTIVHLGLHAVLSGAHLVRWLQDIHHVVQSGPVPWPEVVERASRTGVNVGLAVALRRAVLLLGTPLPEGLPASLDRSRTRAVASSVVDRGWLAGSEPGALVAAGWAKTVRPSWRDTVVAAVQRTWRVGHYRSARWRRTGGGPMQSRHVGSPNEQAEFLAAVAAAGDPR